MVFKMVAVNYRKKPLAVKILDKKCVPSKTKNTSLHAGGTLAEKVHPMIEVSPL